MTAFCIDAGATNSRARLMEDDGTLLAEAKAGPCNPSNDTARAAASLHELWNACAGGRSATDVTLAIGGAGLYVAPVRAAFLAAIPAFGRHVIMSDGYAALIGAGGGVPSALVIAGTGAVAHRLFADGTSIQRDGWGWIGGDRGSGAWIGRRAMRHALAVLDGIGPPDALSEAIIDELGARDRKAGTWIAGLGPDRLAALVPLVLSHPCATSAAILQRAAEHIAALAGTLYPEPGVPVFLAGGLADTLRADVTAILGYPAQKPQADAITGCFLVATGKAPPEVSRD